MLKDLVLVDTSSIIFAMHNRKDIFSITKAVFPDRTVCVSEGVVSELKRISTIRSKKGREAAAGLRSVFHNNIPVEDDEQRPDDWMVEINSARCIFLTNDTKLWHRLKAAGKQAMKISVDGRIV